MSESGPVTGAHDRTDTALAGRLRRWVAAGLITPEQGAAIERFEMAHAATAADTRLRISFGAVLMYLGGFLILLAVTIFLALSWESYGLAGQVVWAALAVGGLWLLGSLLRRKESARLAGDLLTFAGTGAVPLLVYTLVRLSGFLPHTLESYDTGEFQARVQATWTIIAIASIAAALVTALRTRFGPALLLAGLWGWLLATDLTRWARQAGTWAWDDPELWAGAAAGVALLGAGLLALRGRHRPFATWLFLAGHTALFLNLAILGLSRESLGLALLFLALYLAIVIASVWLQSTVFLVFGAGGTYGLICYLVLRNLRDAGSITLGLVFIGLFVAFTGIAYQKWIEPRLLRLFSQMKRPAAT